MDKLSYALGLSMGGNFIGSGIKKLDINDFADGLRAIFEGAEQKMTFDEAKQIVTEFFTNLEKQGAEENERLGREYLEKNKSAEGVQVTASGLQYQVIKEGEGEKPGPNDVVRARHLCCRPGHPRLGRGSAADARGFGLQAVHPV